MGLALKLHVALGGIAHRPLESPYSAQTFRVGSKLTNSASRLGFWADVGMSAARPRTFAGVHPTRDTCIQGTHPTGMLQVHAPVGI